MSQLSTHFHTDESARHDSARTPVPRAYPPAVEYLCKELLEPMRDRIGPCTVDCRCHLPGNFVHLDTRDHEARGW